MSALPADAAALLDGSARRICRERCAFMGEPPCFNVRGDNGEALPWPNPNCDDPGCQVLARVVLSVPGQMVPMPPVAQYDVKRDRLLRALAPFGGEAP